jgi:hypothetical protein
MDQSNLDFLGKLFVAENETFLVGSILAILINYVVRNFKHYRTLLKGAMKAISANCCYQWELGQCYGRLAVLSDVDDGGVCPECRR